MRGMADDWEVGGPIRLICRGYERGKSWHFGPVDSKVQFVDPIEGHVQPERFMIMNRAGCDLHPVDVATADGRLLLTSFVWPFDLHRHQRLSSALSVAATHPMRVDKAAASNWLPQALVVDRDVLLVVWHSITQRYWPIEEVMAVESILTSYGAQQPLAEVSLEFDLDDPRGVKPELRTRLWNPDSDRSVRERLIGTAHDHGIPVTLAASPS
jgi:hypothetical protein